MNEIKIEYRESNVFAILPITRPTSKVRVKRKGKDPIAVRKNIMTNEDYLEWQISYKNKDELIEAGKILELAVRYEIVSRDDLLNLKNRILNINEYFNGKFHILPENNNEIWNGFMIKYERIPIAHKDLNNGCYIEIKLAHKQKAVGYQSMLYVYIPITIVQSLIDNNSLLNRKAYKNENIAWKLTKEDIKEIIYSFAVLSEVHKKDIINIIDQIFNSS